MTLLRKQFLGILLLVAVAVVALAPGGAFARALEAKEKTELQKTVAEFNAAMSALNFERIIETLPPKVLNAIAIKGGIPPEDVRKAMIEIFKTAMTQVKIDAFSMDFDKAGYKELKGGSPYALIPTQTTVTVPEHGTMVQKSHSLALLDEGKWYLLRISEAAQLMILKEVYPEFARVEFPQGSMEMLKK